MAGIAYAGTENPITLVKRDDGYTYINVIGEFDGGITMAAIETVEETQNSDGSLVYTETGDHDFIAIKGDGEMIKTAVTHLVIEKYKNVERTLNELGEIVAVPQTQFYLLIAAGAAVAVVAAAVIVITVKSKKKASNNARSDETAS